MGDLHSKFWMALVLLIKDYGAITGFFKPLLPARGMIGRNDRWNRHARYSKWSKVKRTVREPRRPLNSILRLRLTRLLLCNRKISTRVESYLAAGHRRTELVGRQDPACSTPKS